MPIGVFLVLIVALRDPLACLNLVATMVLTYAFALGATHLVFVTLLGAEGLDWKVPYFLFVLLIAVGVDYNVFLMTRLNEESQKRGLRDGIVRAIGQTGGLISSAAMITASSFASFLFSPLGSLRQLGFALVVGILIDAILVRPLLVPCGHWLLRAPAKCSRPTSSSAGAGASTPSFRTRLGIESAHPARPRYSPVRVSTRTVTPWSRCSGTWTTAPVDSVAGLVRPVAELPRTPGAVSTIGSSTVSGSSIAITSSSTTSASTPSMFSVMNGTWSRSSSSDSENWLNDCRIHEVERVGIAVQVLDRPALEARLVERVGPAIRFLDPGLGLEVAGLDLVERGRAAGRRGLNLDLLDHVRRTVDLDDHPALEILGGNHGDPSLSIHRVCGLVNDRLESSRNRHRSYRSRRREVKTSSSTLSEFDARTESTANTNNPLDTRVRVC